MNTFFKVSTALAASSSAMFNLKNIIVAVFVSTALAASSSAIIHRL